MNKATKQKCPECGRKLKLWIADEVFPNGAYHCKYCPNLYKHPKVIEEK